MGDPIIYACLRQVQDIPFGAAMRKLEHLCFVYSKFNCYIKSIN